MAEHRSISLEELQRKLKDGSASIIPLAEVQRREEAERKKREVARPMPPAPLTRIGDLPDTTYTAVIDRELTRSMENLLNEDADSYLAKGLTQWAQEVRTLIQRWNSLSSVERNYLEQKRSEGWIILGMPSAQTQLDTMAAAIPALRPTVDGARANETYVWDHVSSLIATKNPALVAEIPNHPYFFIFQPTERPPVDSCSKTVDQQIQWVNDQHAQDTNLFAIQPAEYVAAQTRLTEKGGASMDASTWTRMIKLPLHDGDVAGGGWNPDAGLRQLRFVRADADYGSSYGGVRLVGRV